MKDERLNGISLFSGIGGLDLAIQEDVRTVCYVEKNSYCQEVLKARIQDGFLDDAPIWADIRTFDGKPWLGRVDIVSGGFPCTNISTSGNKEGIRHGNESGMWFEMYRVISEVRPKVVFLENVANLTRRGLDVVLGGLSRNGYDAIGIPIYAYDVGAAHKRKRIFVLAYTPGFRCSRRYLERERIQGNKTRPQTYPSVEDWLSWCRSIKSLEEFRGRGDIPKPLVCRDIYGSENGVDRIKALGNAVVPAQGREAWRRLTRLAI